MSSAHVHAPKLWHIALDKDSDSRFSRDRPIYDQAENACRKYGIKFETKDLEKYSKGPRHW